MNKEVIWKITVFYYSKKTTDSSHIFFKSFDFYSLLGEKEKLLC